MNCLHCREQLTLLQSDALDATERAAVEAHLAQCPECAREWRALEAMRATLVSLPAAPAPPQLRANVRAALQPKTRRALPFALPIAQARGLAWGRRLGRRRDWTDDFGASHAIWRRAPRARKLRCEWRRERGALGRKFWCDRQFRRFEQKFGRRFRAAEFSFGARQGARQGSCQSARNNASERARRQRAQCRQTQCRWKNNADFAARSGRSGHGCPAN